MNDVGFATSAASTRARTGSATTRAEMLARLRSREKYCLLPGAFYTDPSYYEIDLETLFHRRWLFAGLSCQIAEPGQ